MDEHSDLKPGSDSVHRQRAGSEFDRCLLVEAGAGTGKTTILIERILQSVLSGRARMSEMVAITFTEKAAGEMMVRLRSALEKRMHSAKGSAGDAVQRALYELDNAAVMTIHGFCASVLREFPIEAGVETGFSVADAQTSGIILRDAWDKWYADELCGDSDALETALRLQLNGDKLFGVAEVLVSHYRDRLEHLPEPQGTADALRQGIRETARAFAGLLAEMEPKCKSTDDLLFMRVKRSAEWLSWAQDLDPGVLFNAVLVDAQEKRPLHEFTKSATRQGNKTKWRPGALDEARTSTQALAEQLKELTAVARHDATARLCAWLKGFCAEYENRKRRLGCLDFMDLLLLAERLLRTDRTVRQELKQRFKYVLVDEFQDTDPVQARIVFYLAEEQRTFAGDWRDVRLEPGKLFIVGDPKQSIYRFRRADIELYEDVKRLIERTGNLLYIKRNFRSTHGLLSVVNSLFERFMQKPEDGEYQPQYVPIFPDRAQQRQGPSVIVLEREEERKLNRQEAAAEEANAVASFILEGVSGRSVLVDDPREGRRPARWKDMAVLLRATTHLQAYEDALAGRGIPYHSFGQKTFYTRVEVQALLNVLKAAADPTDEASLLGALCSPFFGFSYEDVYLYRRLGHRLSYLPEASEPTTAAAVEARDILGAERAESVEKAFADAFGVLGRLHAMRNTVPVGRMLDELAEATGGLAVFALKPSGPQRLANLDKLAELAYRLRRQQGASLRSCITFLEGLRRTGQEEGDSPVLEPGDDFVSLLTIHKSKGLEFPVVILGDPTSGRIERSKIVPTISGLEVSVSADLSTRGYDPASELEKRRTEAEEIRLLYVALTRARDYVALPMGWSRKNVFTPLLDQLRHQDDACVETRSVAGGEGEEVDREAFTAAGTGKATRGAEDSRNLLSCWERKRRLNAEAVCARLRCVRPSALGRQRRPGAEEDAQRDVADPSAAAVGTLVHRLLESVDLAAPSDLETMARGLADELGLSEGQAADATEMVRRALSSPIMQRAARARTAYRELPFTLSKAAGPDGARCVTQGAMDLLFEDDAGLVLVDYKTDSVTPEEMESAAAVHAPQLLAYAEALRDILGRDVAEIYVFFLRLGEAQRIAPRQPTGQPGRRGT